MEVHEAAEMYLETILVLKNRLGLVRSIDVANEMGLFQTHHQHCYEKISSRRSGYGG